MTWLSAAPCARLGDLGSAAGRLPESRMWYDRSLSLWLARPLGAAQTLAGLARLRTVEGRLDEAREHLDTGLATAERCGSRVEYAFLAIGYAGLTAAGGRADSARALFALGLFHGPRAGLALRPVIDAELGPLCRCRRCGSRRPGEQAQAMATPLEEPPGVIRQLVGA